MPALHNLQSAVAGAIFTRNPAAIADLVWSNGLSSLQRVQLYQNNVFISLTQALADVYPVVERLVGEAFFRFTARRYIQRHPSVSGNLHEFGRELAAFLSESSGNHGLPYLTDVAALEWAYHEVFHAGVALPIDLTRLARIPDEEQDRLRLRLHPARRLIASRYPVLAIWEANRGDAVDVIDLDVGGDFLLVARRDLECQIERITPGEFVFLAEVDEGATLEQACEAAESADSDMDIGATVRRFAADHTIAGFHDA